MEGIIVESWNLPPQPLTSPSRKNQVQNWKEEAEHWKKGRMNSPCGSPKKHKHHEEKHKKHHEEKHKHHEEKGKCWKKWEELSPRWKMYGKPQMEEVEIEVEEEDISFEGEEKWEQWKKNSPCWKGKTLKDRMEAEKSCCYPSSYCAEGLERLPQSCVSKPYLNLAEALLLDRSVLQSVEILTSPSSVYIDICKLAEHFPNLRAAYNIFIKVRECNAELVHKLDLRYGLFLLDPLAPELTLTALLPHLHPEGHYVFFYCKGMISINKDVLVVRETQIPENLTKLVRAPQEYPCKEGTWNPGAWKVYAVNLQREQCACLERISREGTIKLEHVKIRNQNCMIYGSYCLRQFIEALVLSMNCTALPSFVLSGIGSVPLLETIIYVYAQENDLVTDDRKIKVDLLMEAWAGDCLRGVVTMCEIKKFILKNRGCANCCVDLMLRDPLLVLKNKEEQELYAFGKPFAAEGSFKPHYLTEKS